MSDESQIKVRLTTSRVNAEDLPDAIADALHGAVETAVGENFRKDQDSQIGDKFSDQQKFQRDFRV